MGDNRGIHDVIVIGSGFGGTINALAIAREFQRRFKTGDVKTPESVLVLERGTWWTTPVPTVKDPTVTTRNFLEAHAQPLDNTKQPVQVWSTLNHFRGLLDILTRCFRRRTNPDGLYEMTFFRRRGLPFVPRGDGVAILRASAVGGGSMIYSNITVRPPDFVLDDPRWPQWPTAAPPGSVAGSSNTDWRNSYFDAARDCIGLGVLHALDVRENVAPPAAAPNAGLSNIVTRSGRLDPGWRVVPTPNNKRGLKQIDQVDPPPPAPAFNMNPLWIDRARVFQSTMKAGPKVSPHVDEFGTVDSAINDQPIQVSDPAGKVEPQKVINYCERQGRCNVGCLPGARHTLNKQLMSAIYGSPPAEPKLVTGQEKGPLSDHLKLQTDAEVEYVRMVDGGYEIVWKKTGRRWWSRLFFTRMPSLRARRVVIAAGCVGTNDLLLRCKDRKTIPGLTDDVGHHFSTNGDYIAFMEQSEKMIGLTRGPVTTSFAHFNVASTKPQSYFHTLEDQGIPPAIASTIGVGIPMMRSLVKRGGGLLAVFLTFLLWIFSRGLRFVGSLLGGNARKQSEFFQSPEQRYSKMMCVIGMGRDKSNGRFKRSWTGGLRLDNDKPFHKDPIYTDHILPSIDNFGEDIGGQRATTPGADKRRIFRNPFWSPVTRLLGYQTTVVTHPLGGCTMEPSSASGDRPGVVDAKGRVKNAAGGVLEGLYVADGSIIPTGLGVNPSLTISAVALSISDQIIEEIRAKP